MSLYDILKRAIGWTDQVETDPPMAQITIISTDPVKRSTGSRSRRAQG